MRFKVLKRPLGQSAMEYLTTYGWAILIIVLTISVLYELGVFNPNTYVLSSCVLPSGLDCSKYLLSTNGILTVTIKNTMQDPINITALGCVTNETTSGMQAPYSPISNQVYIPVGGNYTFNIYCPAARNSTFTSIYKGYVSVNYTDDVTGFAQTVFGRLIIKASSKPTTSTTLTISTTSTSTTTKTTT
ncbi:MAG: hypothetical protein ACP5RF_02625, partial [Candidatus Micrarchaeia archaeon]